MAQIRNWLFCLAGVLSAPGRAESLRVDWCHGRYAEAAVMVDAAFRPYGTLYSGGLHHHRLDNVGATVDLYRLWSGLPDLALRDARGEVHWDEVELADADHLPELRRAALVSRPDADTLDEAARYRAIVRLDLATVLDDPVDWWRIPGPVLGNPARTALREVAADEPFVDWLQAALVASNTVPGMRETRTTDGHQRLSRHAREQWLATSHPGWLVLWHEFTSNHNERSDLRETFRVLHQRVVDCSATSSDYAAWAAIIGGREDYFEKPDPNWLPTDLRKRVVKRWAWARPHGNWSSPSAQHRAAELGVSELAPWLAVVGSYTAHDEAALIAAHQGIAWMPKSVRVINMMSVDGLVQFARSPGVNSSQRASLLRVAFARAYALGRDRLAWNLLPELSDAFPEHSQAIADTIALRMARHRRLALVALLIPDLSTGLHPDSSTLYDGDFQLSLRHGGEWMDLPQDLALGYPLQDDVWTFWQHPAYWNRYHGMRGSHLPEAERMYSRLDGEVPDSSTGFVLNQARLPAEVSYHGRRDVTNWAAWEELTAVSGSRKLSIRLTKVLIDCADHPGWRWFRRDHCRSAKVADGLARLVRINRWQPIEPIDGIPAGKLAFQALYRNFPDSSAAAATPYWYE